MLRKKTTDPIVLLDSGGLLFKHPKLSAAKEKQAKITAKGIVDAYNAMGFSAVGIAEQDLSGGLDFLQQIADQAEFDWLSANLVNQADQSALFTPGKIISAGKIKLAILGITNESAQKYLAKDSKAIILPWQDVLPGLIEKYSKQADLIILLSSYSAKENKKIIDSTPGINILLNSDQRPRNLTPVIHKNTLLIQVGKKGKYQGILDIHWHPSHVWQVSRASEYNVLKNNLANMENQVQKFEKKEKESSYLSQNLGAKRAYEVMLANIPEIKQKLKDTEEELKKEAGQEKTASMYVNQLVALKKAMPDEPEILAIVNKINQQIRQIEKAKKPKKSAFKPFTGWQACQKCHPKQTNVWRQSRHAAAYSTLVKKKQGKNRDCIACHVTGIITGDEPRALSLPSKLRQVGCESCHGPGEMHIAAPKNWPMTTKPNERICLRCHTPEQDDNFNYQLKVKKLGCPKLED